MSVSRIDRPTGAMPLIAWARQATLRLSRNRPSLPCPARPTVPPRLPASARLNGWKDIANYLGKGVRTVQRWEQQYGLPVHRLGAEGEVVFAGVHEVDAWLANDGHAGNGAGAEVAETPEQEGVGGQPASKPEREGFSRASSSPLEREGVSPAPSSSLEREGFSRATRSLLPAGIALLVLGLLWIGYVQIPGASPRQKLARLTRGAPQPVRAEVRGQVLRAYDADGAELWRRPFESPMKLTRSVGTRIEHPGPGHRRRRRARGRGPASDATSRGQGPLGVQCLG